MYYPQKSISKPFEFALLCNDYAAAKKKSYRLFSCSLGELMFPLESLYLYQQAVQHNDSPAHPAFQLELVPRQLTLASCSRHEEKLQACS
jgi:hypothetical protein